MKLSLLSLIPSAIGVAAITTRGLTEADILFAAVCFAVAFGMIWAAERRRR